MTTEADAGMSLNEVINNAIQAEAQGVPVNWRDLCMTVYNVATTHIANLEQQDEPEVPDDMV